MSSDVDDFYVALADIFTSTWRSLANCVGKDLEIFSDEQNVDQAKGICSACCVKVECLDNSIYFNDGLVRGGLTERERNSVELHRKRHLAAFRSDSE
jgi:hypothetical protein